MQILAKLIVALLFLHANIFSLTNSSIKSQKNKSKWSDYQGIMTWQEAKIKCKNLGMRLPKIAEFKDAYKAKETAKWNTDMEKDRDLFYWTSKEDLSEGNQPYLAYYFDKGNGDFYREFMTISKAVRCIR